MQHHRMPWAAGLRDRGHRLPADQPVCSYDLGRIRPWRPAGLSAAGQSAFWSTDGFCSAHLILRTSSTAAGAGHPGTQLSAGRHNGARWEFRGWEISRREEMLALNRYEGPRVKRRVAKLATVFALWIFSVPVLD